MTSTKRLVCSGRMRCSEPNLVVLSVDSRRTLSESTVNEDGLGFLDDSMEQGHTQG